MAQEEPDIVSVALRPGMVDTGVSFLCTLLFVTELITTIFQMQDTIRSIGAPHMTQADHSIFIKAHEDGKLVKPADVGYAIAALSLRASKSLSGEFVSWDSELCLDYRRK